MATQIHGQYIADGAIGAAKLAADAVDGTKIADDAIDSEHLAAGAIDAEHFAAGAVDTTALGADAVDGSKIADDAVDSEHLAAGAIDAEHFAAGAVDTTALGADAVDGSKIADDAIDSEHLAAGAIDAEHLSTGAKQDVLQSKLVVQGVAGATQTKSGAGTSHAYDPGSGTYVAYDVSTKGVLGMAAGAGASNPFDTNTSQMGTTWAASNAGPSIFHYRVQIIDANGDAILDGSNEVWALMVDDTTPTLYFYSGDWGPGSSAYTMADSQQFRAYYTQRFDLDDMSEVGFLSPFVDAEAAAIGPGAIDTTELADDAVTAAKLDADTAGAGLAQAGSGALDVNVDDVGIEIATDTVQLKDGGVATAKLADDAVTAAKLNADVAGGGLTQAAGGELDVNIDNSTIGISGGNALEVKDAGIVEAKIDDQAVTLAKLAPDSVDGSKIADNAIDSEHYTDGSIDSEHLSSGVKDRVGGGWDAVSKFDGNGVLVNFDLGHDDAELAEEAMLVTVDGLVMELGASADFQLGNDAGSGGVDQVQFNSAPADGARIIVRYRRTTL